MTKYADNYNGEKTRQQCIQNLKTKEYKLQLSKTIGCFKK